MKFLAAACQKQLSDLFPVRQVYYDPLDPVRSGRTLVADDAEWVADAEWAADGECPLPGDIDDHYTARYGANAANRSPCWLFRFVTDEPFQYSAWRPLLKALPDAFEYIDQTMMTPIGYRFACLRIRLQHMPPELGGADITNHMMARQALEYLMAIPIRGGLDLERTVIEHYPAPASPACMLMTTDLDSDRAFELAGRGADMSRYECSDLNEVMTMFGIEAARQHFINEIRAVYTSSNLPSSYRHVAIVADQLTASGRLLPFDYYGMRKSVSVSPLSLASFERPTTVLMDAAIHARTDNCNSAPARVMLGMTGLHGTGQCEVINSPAATCLSTTWTPPVTPLVPVTVRPPARRPCPLPCPLPPFDPVAGTSDKPRQSISELLQMHSKRLGLPLPRTQSLTSPSRRPASPYVEKLNSPTYCPASPRRYFPPSPIMHRAEMGQSLYDPEHPSDDQPLSPWVSRMLTYTPTHPSIQTESTTYDVNLLL
jgi:hypothetical protein